MHIFQVVGQPNAGATTAGLGFVGIGTINAVSTAGFSPSGSMVVTTPLTESATVASTYAPVVGTTLNVASTSGFTSSGVITVTPYLGTPQTVAYTGTTPTSFTGITAPLVGVNGATVQQYTGGTSVTYAYAALLGNSFIGVTPAPSAIAGSVITQASGLTSARPYAQIQFGTDGFMEPPFLIDMGRGVRLTGEGNYVSVNVGMGVPLAGFTSSAMVLGGRLGFFAAPAQSPLMYTSYIDNLASNAASTIIPVPERANYILPPQMSSPAGVIQIYFYDSAGNQIYTLVVTSGGAVSPIPLTGDIFAIQVLNQAMSTQTIRIPWQIST